MGKLHEALRKGSGKPAPAGASASSGDAPENGIVGAAAAQKAVAANYAGALYRGESDPHLVPLAAPHSPLSEQYRTLRTNLLAQASAHSMKVFVVTSAVAGEGKSITASNLACVLAEDPQKKVVLIDGDMRKPTLHALFGIDNHRGLSDYLAGGSMLEMALQRSRLPNLWVLPAGHVPTNPTELVASKRMEDLVTRLRRDYDWIVVDTPPVLSTTDAAALSPRADGTLLVVRMQKTQRDVVKHAVDQLRKSKGNVMGTVLTGLSGDVEGHHGKAAGAA